MHVYDTFCQAVSDAVSTATKQEKAAIRQELMEHLEDHAAGLMETQGLSEEDAAEAAVAAMGDPQEIGRALNEKYSHLWRILCDTVTSLLIVLVVLTAIPLAVRCFGLYASFSHHRAAQTAVSTSSSVLPMDEKIVIGDQVLRLYGVEYDTWKAYYGHPELRLYFCCYDQAFWRTASADIFDGVTFYTTDGDLLPSTNDGGWAITSEGNTYCCSYDVLVDGLIDELTICYHGRGYDLSKTVPIPQPPASYRLSPVWREQT